MKIMSGMLLWMWPVERWTMRMISIPSRDRIIRLKNGGGFYLGRDDKRVNLESESVRFFDDVEKVVSGDASVHSIPFKQLIILNYNLP